MRSSVRISVSVQLALAAVVFGGARGAEAIYLDEDRDISLRARVYSQVGIRTQNSELDTVPSVEAGQLVQHRNFYNPELDAKLTKYTKWMSNVGLGVLEPTDFGFRVAGWGFYDGIYDYGTSQFGETLSEINTGYPDPIAKNAFYLQGESFRCPVRRGNPNDGPGYEGICLESLMPATGINGLDGLFPHHELRKPRDIYAHQNRVNELYLSYTKGPLFVRLGRQAISWGEADTIAILDQNNPFDISRGAPGAFQDLDEARIPLWTIRTTLDLFEELGPLQSGMIEAYWVPGMIDTETGDFPILTASPYSPRGIDPQGILATFNSTKQFVLFDHSPRKRMSNSRYGFRFQTIVARDHTLSLWYYTHFPNAPVPRSRGTARLTRTNGQAGLVYTVEAAHKLTGVVGVADTFYLEPIDSIFRMEAEYFINEPSFIPKMNLGADKNTDTLKQLEYVGRIPNADFLRWEVGLDRNVFIRPINPSNSFLFVGAIVGSWNTSETFRDRNYYYQGQRKPGELGTKASDFVALKEVEVFGQFRVATSYLHGKIEPGIINILNARGTHAVIPQIDFRLTDYLLFSVKYLYIGGAYQQLGFYRDRDQLALRATYQLN